jgi:hypothetical protein
MGFSLDFICYFGENYVFYCDFRLKITFFLVALEPFLHDMYYKGVS